MKIRNYDGLLKIYINNGGLLKLYINNGGLLKIRNNDGLLKIYINNDGLLKIYITKVQTLGTLEMSNLYTCVVPLNDRLGYTDALSIYSLVL